MSLVSELHLCEGCLVLYNGALGKKWNIGAHKLQIISYGSDHMCRQECLNTSNKWSYSVSVAASLPPSLIPGGWGSLYFRCDESDTLGRSHLNSTHCFAHRMVTLAAVWRNRAGVGARFFLAQPRRECAHATAVRNVFQSQHRTAR